MATLKNTTINDTGFLRLPKGTTAQRPANAAGRIRHNTETGTVEYYSENALAGGWTQMTIPFQNRTIITNAYIQGGYKSSAAWNNINRTLTATDTTYNLGDGAIEASFNYQPGACSLNDAYIFGAGGGHAVSSNYVTAFNMRTEQQTTDIDRSLAINRHNFGAVFQEHYLAWCSGGSSTLMEEYNLTTKTYNGQIGATSLSGANWGMSSENIGIQNMDLLGQATKGRIVAVITYVKLTGLQILLLVQYLNRLGAVVKKITLWEMITSIC